jgi:hypothetical protein
MGGDPKEDKGLWDRSKVYRKHLMNKEKTIVKHIAFMVALAIAIAPFASAAVTEWSNWSEHLDKTDWGCPGSSSYPIRLSMPQFDITLGTLQSVEWEAEGYIIGTVTYYNSGGPNQANATIWAVLKVYAPESDPLVDSPLTTLQTGIVDDLGVVGNGLYGPSSWTSPVVSDHGFLTDGLSRFIGSGSVDMTASASARSFVYGSGNCWWVLRTVADEKARIRYCYEPTPELGPASLLVLGMLPIGFLRWRRVGKIGLVRIRGWEYHQEDRNRRPPRGQQEMRR